MILQNIISTKDNSIWNLEIETLDNTFRFVISNDNQKYESYKLHFTELSPEIIYEDVLDFDSQQKIVRMIIEKNDNLTIRHTWMKRSIYKMPENEILAFHIMENESKKEYTINIGMK